MLAHSGHIMTLANSIIGVGILAMPFCFLKCGIVLSIVLLIVSGWVTRLCCHYLIKSSLLTRRKCYEFLGFHAFGPSGKLLVELCIIGYLLGTCITYFVVVGDLGPQIITRMFSLDDGYTHLRTITMLVITLICILPLGMLKNVDSLSTVCTASIGFYVCFVLKIILESNEHIVANDWTAKVVYWQPSGVLQCLPIFSMSLSCQMQIFEVFGSVHNQSVEKLNGIVRNATWICTCVYVAVGFFGYVAFCTQPFSGNILLNFSTSFGSDVIKIGFILSVAFSFPLVIFPCRASLYSLLYRKGHTDASSSGSYIPEARFKAITVFIVAFSLCIALMIPSVELIIGLVGSTIGVAICIMFPASCFRKIVRKESTERLSAQFILAAGFCLMILGTYANLNAIDEKRSGIHTLPLPPQTQQLKPTIAEHLAIAVDKIDFAPPQKLKQIEKKEQARDKTIIDGGGDGGGNVKKDNPPPAYVVSSPPPPSLVKSNQTQAGVQNEMPVLPLGPMADPQAEESKSLLKDPMNVKEVENAGVIPAPKTEAPKSVERKPPAEAPKAAIDAAKSGQGANDAAVAAPQAMPSASNSPPQQPPQQPQTIASDAIQNNDAVAAEESKDAGAQSKTADDELKKTQNELKKTKELLERTVDELKEELAKQNKETQNLVVEKLGEVVEKVEQIERKVQKSDNEQKPPPPPQPQPQPQAPGGASMIGAPKQHIPIAEANEPTKTGSLLSRLTENVNNDNNNNNNAAEQQKAPPKPGEVYEPLSYKTGEIIEQAMNGGGKIDQRLPLPLALLINAAQAKTNTTTSPAMASAKAVKTTAVALAAKSPVEPKAQEVKSEKEQDKIEKDNVEAIRRDILQLNSKFMEHEHEFTTVLPIGVHDQSAAAHAMMAQRVKRSPSDVYEFEKYLTDPKEEMLMLHGMSNALDVEKQSFGRDLKSIQESENT